MTHLERDSAGAVFVRGDLVLPSGRRHPITLPPQDWEALESALAVSGSSRADGQWCECDATRPVVEAARAWRKLGHDAVRPGAYNGLAYAAAVDAVAAAVDALDGTP